MNNTPENTPMPFPTASEDSRREVFAPIISASLGACPVPHSAATEITGQLGQSPHPDLTDKRHLLAIFEKGIRSTNRHIRDIVVSDDENVDKWSDLGNRAFELVQAAWRQGVVEMPGSAEHIRQRVRENRFNSKDRRARVTPLQIAERRILFTAAIEGVMTSVAVTELVHHLSPRSTVAEKYHIALRSVDLIKHWSGMGNNQDNAFLQAVSRERWDPKKPDGALSFRMRPDLFIIDPQSGGIILNKIPGKSLVDWSNRPVTMYEPAGNIVLYGCPLGLFIPAMHAAIVSAAQQNKLIEQMEPIN